MIDVIGAYWTLFDWLLPLPLTLQTLLVALPGGIGGGLALAAWDRGLLDDPV